MPTCALLLIVFYNLVEVWRNILCFIHLSYYLIFSFLLFCQWIVLSFTGFTYPFNLAMFKFVRAVRLWPQGWVTFCFISTSLCSSKIFSVRLFSEYSLLYFFCINNLPLLSLTMSQFFFISPKFWLIFLNDPSFFCRIFSSIS